LAGFSVYGHRVPNAGNWGVGRWPSECGGRFPAAGQFKASPAFSSPHAGGLDVGLAFHCPVAHLSTARPPGLALGNHERLPWHYPSPFEAPGPPVRLGFSPEQLRGSAFPTKPSRGEVPLLVGGSSARLISARKECGDSFESGERICCEEESQESCA
jgi:hypothetical protein